MGNDYKEFMRVAMIIGYLFDFIKIVYNWEIVVSIENYSFYLVIIGLFLFSTVFNFILYTISYYVLNLFKLW